ncbi:hypothetical protein J6590_094428, partial [Homalodisca vitripennis]
ISQEKLIEMSPHVLSADVTVQLHLFDMKENTTADIDATDITREADRDVASRLRTLTRQISQEKLIEMSPHVLSADDTVHLHLIDMKENMTAISQEKLIEMSPHVLSADDTVHLHLIDMKENRTADIDATDITREADRDVASRFISQEKLIEMSPYILSADVTVQLHLIDMKENMTADIDGNHK